MGLSQRALAARGPLSRDRLQAVEGAKRDDYSLGILAALERALGWRAGSVEAVLAGGEAALAPAPAPAPEDDLVIEHAPGIREHLMPPGVAERLGDDVERHLLELTVSGEKGSVFVSWTGELPPDLRAIVEDIKAQQRLLSRRDQVQREAESTGRDPRNGTDG